MDVLHQQTVVIGAGIQGCTIAYRLACEGRDVLLLDRAQPGIAGASFGNAGRIAVELVQPIPSPRLLLSFWRDLFAFGGSLDLPLARAPHFAPWALRFARAAFRRRANTDALVPIVRDGVDRWAALLAEVGRSDLLAKAGHYHFWTGSNAERCAQTDALSFEAVGVPSEPAGRDVLRLLRRISTSDNVAGRYYADSAHAIDPAQICAVLVQAAMARGANFRQTEVRSLSPGAEGQIEVRFDDQCIMADEAIVCSGAESIAMLARFGVRAPIEPARGYHVELPGHEDHFGASAIFMDSHLAVTPMAGRVRASGFLDFADHDAPADRRKEQRLLKSLRALGYDCSEYRCWHGSRGMLPDTLPGVGRGRTPHRLFYAVGGQMIGLTIAATVADMMRDLVLQGRAEHAAPFDLARFG